MTRLRQQGSIASTTGWYVARGQEHDGPFSLEILSERLRLGELSWMQFAWKKGMPGWKRFSELPEFSHAAPAAPSVTPKLPEALQPAAVSPGPIRKKSEPRDVDAQWYLHVEGSQQGPFNKSAVEDLLRSGKIPVRTHAWTSGMSTWVRLGKVRAFEELIGTLERVQPPAMKKQSAERRTSPRKPLVARLLYSDQKEVFEGLCRDVSVGGMQVLTSHLPGGPGTRLRLNIDPNPGKNSGKKPRSLEPFVAEGIVVRILEDQRGFSFRFERLQPEARKAIEAWIAGENRELSGK